MEDKVTIEIAASIEERYVAGSPRSRELFERGLRVMPGGAKGAYFYKPYPLTMERGDGPYLYDVDGRRFVDFVNHHTAQILGHHHPAVIEVVQERIRAGIALGAPVGVEAELSEEMCRRVASLDRIRFCNSGTEATLHAIRLARGFSGRPKIAKFEGGYHGSHDLVEISTGPPLEKAGPESAPHAVPNAGGISPNAVNEVVVLPYNDEAAAERLISEHRDDLACVILDPKAGILPVRQEFIQAVREITRKNDVLLILDEIVGFRVGTGGFQEYCGISPDLTTYGKIVGGGFPVGAFGGRADIMDLLDNTRGSKGFFQSGTFSANPMTMAAGSAMLRELTPDAFAHLNGLGDRLRSGLNDLFDRDEIPARCVVSGSVFSIHFTDEDLVNYRSLSRIDNEMTHLVFHGLIAQGYFLNYTLSMCALSLPMDEGHVDGLVEALGRAVEEAKKEMENEKYKMENGK